jgi:hypothetical protein
MLSLFFGQSAKDAVDFPWASWALVKVGAVRTDAVDTLFWDNTIIWSVASLAATSAGRALVEGAEGGIVPMCFTLPMTIGFCQQG